jgi:hypothetical protein
MAEFFSQSEKRLSYGFGFSKDSLIKCDMKAENIFDYDKRHIRTETFFLIETKEQDDEMVIFCCSLAEIKWWNLKIRT